MRFGDVLRAKIESAFCGKEEELMCIEQKFQMAQEELRDLQSESAQVGDTAKIELSAWKLEMQNALNDIELLKRERDDLKARVKS